ncbi:PAS domain S-box protein [Marispirochaeta aestuarii]|nr:PAS domain S-box protein [Marispirochaeta aestuarii]
MTRHSASGEQPDLTMFFSLSPDLLCIADTSGIILKTNMAWKDILGYEPETMEGINFLEFIHPSERKQTLAAVRRNLNSAGSIASFENRIQHTEGGYHDLEWRAIRRDKLIYATARDVTERKRAEHSLLLLSKAVEHNPVSVVITDTSGTISYVNEKFTELTGYKPDEAIGENPGILKSGEQDCAFYTDLWNAISSGKSWRGVFHNRKKNGELYWESALIAPILKESGEISNYVAIKEDITLRKSIEDKLRQSNELLNLFFRQSLDGFFFMMLDRPLEWNESTDKDAALDYAFSHQKITRINRAMLDQYGAEEENFIGLTPADFYQHDMEYGKKVWREFFDNGTLHVDTTEKKFDGTPMTIEGDYICLYDEEGRITGHFGVQRDVSFEREVKEKLRESEERFRQLAENIDQIFFLRTEHRMLYVSPAYEKIFGRSCQSLYDNPDSYQEVIHPEDKNEVLRWYTEDKSEYEYRIILPDGSERWIWASTFPVHSSSGDTQRIAGIARDISERKQLEKQLHEVSIRDTLTGLYNRRHLFEILGALIEKVERGEEIFSLAILDIDHFKSINDNYGHVAGDLVLKEFAQILSRSIRGYDTLGRFGGEEFLIVFTGMAQEKAHKMMDRILAAVREMSIPYGEAAISFTFSCGIADSRVCMQQGCDLEKIINEADTKLYRAKRAGRNRIYSS